MATWFEGRAVLAQSQRNRLSAFKADECVDVHCHCLAGVDDGPEDEAASLQLCQALVDDGFTTVVATPHQLGRYDQQNHPQRVREQVSLLNSLLQGRQIPLRILSGADVRVDERVERLVASGDVLTVADGGRYILLELPHETYLDLSGVLETLKHRGIIGILTHPERHHVLSNKPELIDPWMEQGLVLQVTAGSLLGDFGAPAEVAGWRWLEQGMVQIIATDAHGAKRRPPRMSAAIDAIVKRVSHLVARRICLENPLRVIRGEELPAVRRLRRRGTT